MPSRPSLCAALCALALGTAACSTPSPSPADAAPPGDVRTDALADTAVDAGSACTETPGPFAPLSTRCGHFVDREGRVVILHGVNARVEGVFDVALDMGRAPLEVIPAFTADDARSLRAMGFNVLRLPIQWSAVEPTESGGFDEAYLDRVAAVVSLCRAAGVWVLLDLHQDAYSKEIGEDGAPRWAISPPPTMLLGGPLDDLGARRMSAQVTMAFDTFFRDGAEGDRLRERFARMAAHVAARFRGDSTVLGYEMFNEPQAADENVLRVNVTTARAVREADPGHLVVFEPDVVFRVATNHSRTPRSPFPLAGAVYAPHTYPLSFSATMAQRMTFTRDTLEPATQSAREEATAWGAALLVTEWGYGPTDLRATEYLQWQGEIQDRAMASAMFWLWKEDSQGAWGLHDRNPTTGAWTVRPRVRAALSRVRPEAIPGVPVRYEYTRDTRLFTLVYEGSAAVTAPARIQVPAAEFFAARHELRCDGRVVTATRDEASGVVELPCNGPGTHTITVQGL